MQPQHPANGSPIRSGLRRLAVIAIAALVAVVGGTSQIAHAGEGGTDITGKALGVQIRYPDRDTGKMIEEPIPTIFLGAAAQAALATPLSETFDQLWSGTKDASGKTMLDRACDTAKQEVNSLEASQGQTAYNVSCSFDPTGTLSAYTQVAGDQNNLYLNYLLTLNSVTFTSTAPNCGGTVAAIFSLGTSCIATAASSDPQFTIFFDLDLQISMTVPTYPCQLTPQADLHVQNAFINAEDFQATAAQVFDPSDFAKGVENLDATQESISLASLQSTLNQLASACKTASNYGFGQFDAYVNSQDGLVFRLTHPLDAAPVVTNAGVRDPSVPDLTPPTIGVSAPEVKAGAQLTVTGSSFSATEATDIAIGWNDTTSGTITESDIEWGRKGDKLQDVTLTRAPYDNGSHWDATPLTSDTTYEFRVRDCDQLTCTPYSEPKDVKTTTGGSNGVDFYLDSVAAANKIGSDTVQPGGTFSTALTVPAATTAQKHTLYAQMSGGQQASIDITVVGATDSLKPSIEVIDPTTKTVEANISQSSTFTLRGAAFTAGTVTVSIGTAGGQVLGKTKVKADGTFQANFTLPYSVNGSCTLVASEDVGATSIQATTSVGVIATPR